MVGRSWRRKSCLITCTCSCGSGRPTRPRRWCGHSRAAPRACYARSFRSCATRRRCVVAVVLRRLGRRRLGVDGAPLYRAPVGCGDGLVRRSYVFRLRPTARQHIALAACVESHRELYNAALQERRDGWSHSKTRINYGDQSAQLTEIRSARPDVAVWSFSSQQATLRRLNTAFAGFFGRVKTASLAARLAIRGSRVRPGLTRWSGPRMGTAPAGCPRSGGCICRASARSRFRCTARWRGG